MFVLFSGEWIETTQEDFRDGRYEVNLYSSHRGDGAIEFSPRWDANNDGWIDLVTCDEGGGSKIFWGGTQGFSDDRCTNYERGNGGVGFADLDADGYADYVCTGPVNVYWGESGAPSTSNSTLLQEGAEACFVADFNKDGYLDMAFDNANASQGGVYWGDSAGFTEANLILLPAVGGAHNLEAGDLNKDGWPDLVMVNQDGDNNTVYWGSQSGFNSGNVKQVPFPRNLSHGCSIADLDDDGWLDIVFTGLTDVRQAWIYWGPDFAAAEKTVHQSDECYGGSAVGDLNSDGLLDIVFFRGKSTSYATQILWGDGQRFDKDSSSLLDPVFANSGGLIGDLDSDGSPDIFVNSCDGGSFILYGPDFDPSAITYLHGGRDHHALAREIGNVYTREYIEEYYSSIFDAEESVRFRSLSWQDSCPGESGVRLWVRTGPSADTSFEWSDWVPVDNGLEFPQAVLARCIQYRVLFDYPNPAELPVLFQVGINYEELQAGIVVDPDQADTIDPGESIDYQLFVRNEGNLDDVVDLYVEGPSLAGWNAELLDETGNPLPDPDVDGNFEVGPLAADGGEVNIILRLTAPADALGGDVDTTRVIGESNEEPGVTDLATLITAIRTIPRVDIEPDSTDSTRAGVSVRYRAVVTNLGNFDDAVNLGFQPGHAWPWTLYDSTGATPLVDSDGDTYTDVGLLDAYGDSALVWLELTPPATTTDNTMDTSYLAAFSSLDATVRDSIRLITRVLNPPDIVRGVVIEPDTSGVIEAGRAVGYTLRVINVGNQQDEFILWSVSDLGWPADMITATGQMSPGETLQVELSITPPAQLASIIGDPMLTNTEHRFVWAQSSSDAYAEDSALVVTLAIPPLDIHNYPNPFSGPTSFIYSIPGYGEATLSIFNRAGEHIITLFDDKSHDPGIYIAPWDAKGGAGQLAAPGVYLYVLTFKPEEGNVQRIVKKALLQP